MQLITHVCFEYGTPNEDLIKHLISIVFAEKDGEIFTRQISPYKADRNDSIPIVRSSLLQLLSDCRFVCLLCITCTECLDCFCFAVLAV